MKKKKLLAMLLCMATAVSFTACSKDKPVTEQTGEETALYDDVWDGTYNGKQVKDGVYYIHIISPAQTEMVW